MTVEQIVEALNLGSARPRRRRLPDRLKASFIAPGEPRYIVVNADESEPGTFKDRELMLRNPHALIEGILIMAVRRRAARGLHLHPRRVR